ncbi:MAG: PAS domain S-box protein [Nitrospiraceae bacterium]|nr:PAS domain S-box protein [Nitrospiraceae bacterium]
MDTGDDARHTEENLNQNEDLVQVVRTTQEALRASETRYRRLFEAAQDGILILDADSGKIVDANPFMAKLLGYAPAELVGQELWELGFFKDVKASKVAFRELQDVGYIRYKDLPLQTSAGRQIDVEYVSNLYLVNDKPVIQCNIREITQRKQAEDSLRKSERLNRGLVDHLPHRILVKDRDSVILFCNANYASDLGLAPDAVIGKDDYAFYPPEMAKQYHADDLEVMTSGMMKELEVPYQLGTEEERWVHTVKVPYRDEQKQIIGVLVIFEDITERRRLEVQVRQSQKLEAIGLLAGGIAHDFNNLLTVIRGYCDLLSSRLSQTDPLIVDILEIGKCADRATNLTRQLLAFSRNQILEVQVLDLNALVSGVDRMLQRLIGADIDLQMLLAPHLGRIKADPGQIEQVMMNLIINARDAMPLGGKLILQTENVDLDQEYAGTHVAVTPGRYVMLAVSDNGCGMDHPTQTRIFEPFFTTKERGNGTGLGLATVYGIVKQSNGNIWCYSEPGKGTTFKIYLPRVDEVCAAVVSEKPPPVVRGSETILVAEDEEMVRNLIVRFLTLDGYHVIATTNGADALRKCEEFEGPIHLVITDMVMPGMSGHELWQILAEIRPGTKVLCMSGYIGNAVLSHSMLEEGQVFLQKPFNRDSLNRKVREALDP